MKKIKNQAKIMTEKNLVKDIIEDIEIVRIKMKIMKMGIILIRLM